MHNDKYELHKKLGERTLPGYTENQIKGNAGMSRIVDIFNNEFNWLITTIPNENDMGIDAYVEICINYKAQGIGFMLQNKTGTSHLKEEGGKRYFYFDEKKYNYWSSHKLPVILTFVEDLKNRASLPLWVYFDSDKVFKKGQKFAIEVSKSLSINSETELVNLAYQPNKVFRSIEKLNKNSEIYQDLNKDEVFAEIENVTLTKELLMINFELKDKLGQSTGSHVFSTNDFDPISKDYSSIEDVLDLVKEYFPGLNILFEIPEFVEGMAEYNDDDPNDMLDTEEKEEDENHIYDSSTDTSEKEEIEVEEDDSGIDVFHINEEVYFTINNIAIEYLNLKENPLFSQLSKN